ncbi:MAG: sugar transferase [Paludibacteraceae bacterium]|nr:sugar transferase [Paludibacteraceae bacterium]
MLRRILADILVWIVSATLYILFRLVADKQEVAIYVTIFAVMMAAWIVLGIITLKYYKSYKEKWYWQEMLSMLLTGGLLMLLTYYILPLTDYHYSMTVAQSMIGTVMIVDAFVILGKHYWKFALNMDVPVMKIKHRKNATAKCKSMKRTRDAMEAIHNSVLSITTEEDYQMLLREADLDNRCTKVIAGTDRFPVLQLIEYQYSTLVDMTLLNDMRGINKRLCIINQKLPDDGRYVCCFRPQEYVKKKILETNPFPINWINYSFWFVIKRVVPRLLLMSRLYYTLTKGRKRMLSKTEVLGRLYYCGFEVEKTITMGHIEYVFARRHSQPYEQQQQKLYGPLIKLPRVSKNHEMVYFYKFRTMHPYAEYIQTFVFDQRGGMNIADKSDDDWRITSWGRFMRKYWLDETPMLMNFLKGDIKLVGIRPLSKAMFNTYPAELQEKRTRTKPGLIPPFYIDHPKTFDELYASENKYLDEYFRHPVWTDTKYFFMTVYSILFKRMHSA